VPVFEYKAYDPSRNLVSGTLSADTAANGRQLLRDQGMQLLDFNPVKFRPKLSFSIKTSRGKCQDQVSEFARHLSLLLSTGVSLVEALDVLILQQQGKLLRVVRDVREKVVAGSSLSDALEAHPQWFDTVFCSAVRVGQMTGMMDKALKELAMFIRERQTIKTRLFTALAYPMILSVLGTGVVLFLMSYVIPQLLTVLEASGKSLPRSTVFLKNISDLLTGHWLMIIIALALSISAAAIVYRWAPGRRWCHQMQLRVPLLGTLVRKTLISQFAQMMSLLLRSGVPFVESLALIRGNAKNLILAEELKNIEESVKSGSDIAPTMEKSRIFPPLVVHIVQVGQNTGELTDMLTQLKEGYETEVRLAIGKFTTALEPILIIIMSVVVGFVVFATMMPILETTRVIR